MNLQREYPHLSFKTQWELSKRSLIMLGQSVAYIKAINNTPIIPQYYDELMILALRKGAQATTAIEGNTLSDEEIAKLQQGEKLPPSKEYQEIEVKNILNAFNEILVETVYGNNEQLITSELLLRFHRLVGQNLGEHFNAIPGSFRNNDVVVGSYRCPDYRDVKPLIDKYCEWLRSEFKFEGGKQLFSDIIIQAMVAHVYLEWIHPFGDGNGRTGRLVEFYILSRGGNPDITLHILSNHYNNTRPEYYRQLEKASKTRNLTGFIEYALTGFRDGLQQTLEKIQASQLLNTWQKYVYDKFGDIEIGQKEVFKRRRTLGLEIPIDRKFTFKEIPELSMKLARLYSSKSDKTLSRDLEELIKNEIIISQDSTYFANISVLNKMIAKRKGLLINKP
ncbi:MAG TPA: Fic family protein [Sphingobacteriaceae bacterium]|nr:Fic family protein [Sphingobacteriaceae bacterium]